ncbi:MAG: ABC transporter substrate-binding protein [Oligoflexales bacterium]
MVKKILFLSIISLTLAAKNPDKINLTFLNPSHVDSDFWNTVTSFMKSASKDLGINIRVHYASTDRRHMENYFDLKKDIAANKIPDYLVMAYIRGGASEKIIKMALEANIKVFIFNTDVPDEDRKKIGKPRGKFSNWIGHMFPDDEKAGYDLAEILIKKARKGAANGKIEVVGISGDRLSTAAHLRNKGLRSAVRNNKQELRQVIYADWEKVNATKKTQVLIKRYPKVQVFWSASDFMSLGIVEGIKNSGKIPGKQILTGGVDWMPDALNAIRDGKMTASIGGHFMEGGWVMVMLYDYHNGKDFAESEGIRTESKMGIIHQDNISDYLKYFKDSNWDKIDFKKFSKVLNPNIKKYDFSLDTILNQLNQ